MAVVLRRCGTTKVGKQGKERRVWTKVDERAVWHYMSGDGVEVNRPEHDGGVPDVVFWKGERRMCVDR